jgi:hypothetical protein
MKNYAGIAIEILTEKFFEIRNGSDIDAAGDVATFPFIVKANIDNEKSIKALSRVSGHESAERCGVNRWKWISG